jgi:HEXXH motif-containing protein
MMTEQYPADCFSCAPEQPEDRAPLLARSWQAHAQRTLVAVCEDPEIAGEIRAHSSGLLELCRGVASSGIGTESASGLPVGALDHAAQTGAVDPAYALASATAHLHLRGLPGAWSVRLRKPTRLRFGHWLTAGGSEHRVRATQHRIEVQTPRATGGCSSLTLERASEGWACRGPADTLPTARLWGADVPLFAARDLELLQVSEKLESVEPVAPDVCTEFEIAASFISQFAPAYVGWVRDVVTGVIPLRGTSTSTRSSTHRHRFSFLAASIHSRPVQMAEAFVHESSHEYFFLAEQVHALVNGADPLLYHSPLRKCPRPIRSIFLAYHAVVNMLYLYRASLAQGYQDDGYCTYYSRRLVEIAGEMLRDLSRSPGLSAAGRSFLECTRVQLRLPRHEPLAQAERLSHVS